MGEWAGLIGVIAGALVAFASQYIVRNSAARERKDALLLEQLAIVIALSEDYTHRLWEERNNIASGAVAAWDIGKYRLAEARLKILCKNDQLLAALDSLHDAGGELGTSWRASPRDDDRVQEVWEAYELAVRRFTAMSSRYF
jgi:hypothetical protein